MPIPEARIEKVDNEAKTKNLEGELVEDIPSVAMAEKMAKAHGFEPQNLKEAMRSPDWPRWQEAMEAKEAMLESFGTWRLKKPSPKANIVGYHWTFVLQMA